MKKSEVKKLLKGAKFVIRLQEQQYGILSAWLNIEYKRGDYSETLIRIDAQANNIEPTTSIKAEPNCFKSFPGYTGFYAVQSDAKISLKYSYCVRDNPETAQSVFALISEVIADKNFEYVTPHCDLTQVIRALQVLGCEWSDTIMNGKPYREWIINQNRKAIA